MVGIPHNGALSRCAVVLACVAVAVALTWFCWTLLLWYRLHPHLPWRDVFVILDQLQVVLDGEGGWQQWQFLLEPHYAAHRIAIPRVLVALDLTLLNGQGHLLYGIGWLAILVCLAIYMGLASNYFRGDRVSLVFCMAIAVALFFAPAHLWNLVNAINISWHLTFAAAFLAFLLLLKSAEPPSVFSWLVAYLIATVAALTTFAGVIVWLLLPVMALFRGRGMLLLTLGASLLMTVAYVKGLSSDAEIALGWDIGDPDVIAQLVATSREALQANTPVTILRKTVSLLSWPLSLEYFKLAAALVGASLLVLGRHWFLFLKAQWLGRNDYHPWLKLCVLIATLSLGIAVSVQLGRIMEQPNYAHGPSYERYNTIVAVYWCGIFGLLLSVQARLSAGSRLTLMIVSLVAVGLLAEPRGSYLKQEVASMESAARLYAAGETPALRGKVSKKLLRYKPEYLYSFDGLFAKRESAYLAPLTAPLPVNSAKKCAQGVFEVALIDDNAPKRRGFRVIEGKIGGLDQYRTRDILLFDGGRLVARLHSEHRGDYSPLALAQPEHNQWLGYIEAAAVESDQLLLVFNRLGGASTGCTISGIERQGAHQSANISDRES